MKFAMKLWRHFNNFAVLVVVSLYGSDVHAKDHVLILASTTSTENSGLFAYILPIFETYSQIKTRVIAVGTGQALRLGRNGDADVLLVHNPAAEQAFIAAGYGVDRQHVMYNDFILLGPPNDPAGIKGKLDAVAALKAIAVREAVFVSRGDDSGTHRAERLLWKLTGIDVETASGTWYREAGAGMGAALNIASSNDGYILSDRATWLSFQNKGNLEILVTGDARLFNQYSVIRINPARHSHVDVSTAKTFVNWLVSAAGQDAVRQFQIHGQQLFFPNASEP